MDHRIEGSLQLKQQFAVDLAHRNHWAILCGKGVGMFEDIEKQTGGLITAAEMRRRFRLYLIIFAIALTVLAIAVWSIWKQLG